MNRTKTLVIAVGILAAFVAAAGIAAQLLPTMEAYAHTNNQQNLQGAFNFNNQQFKSNFQCAAFGFACSP